MPVEPDQHHAKVLLHQALSHEAILRCAGLRVHRAVAKQPDELVKGVSGSNGNRPSESGDEMKCLWYHWDGESETRGDLRIHIR